MPREDGGEKNFPRLQGICSHRSNRSCQFPSGGEQAGLERVLHTYGQTHTSCAHTDTAQAAVTKLKQQKCPVPQFWRLNVLIQASATLVSPKASLLASGDGFIAQLCPTLCDPLDCGLPGSSVHGISRVRTLKWVAIPFSRDLPKPRIEPRSPALQADSLPAEPPREPCM